jgi:protein subunit release factor B
MTYFAVSEEKNRWLKEKMKELNVLEKDIEEKFIRGTGRGGQKVNKTSSSVYLKHIPTGIEVKCMKERSQSVNRFLARRELIQKIAKRMNIITKEDLKLGKLKKQKERRRRKSAKKHQAGT